MAAWFSSPSEGAESQRIMQAFSSDQGRTWGEATVLQDFAGKADFDPALFVAGKETFLFFSAFNPQIDIYFRRSSDSAKTWTEPVKLEQPNHTTRSNGIQLSTGELLVPLHTRGTKAGGVMKSRDGGKTWTRFGAVANPEGQGGEPTIAETKSGEIHMMLRTKDGQLWRSISRDKGETWSAPEKTGLTATSSASHLLCTRDGTLVLTYNPGPTPLRFPLDHAPLPRRRRDLERAHAARRSPHESRRLVHLLSHRSPNSADGTLVAIWAQIKSSPGELYGDIHSARIRMATPFCESMWQRSATTDEAGRKAWLRERWVRWQGGEANRFRDSLIKWYGPEKGAAVKFAEAFEICEYGRQPKPEEIKVLFPFFP